TSSLYYYLEIYCFFSVSTSHEWLVTPYLMLDKILYIMFHEYEKLPSAAFDQRQFEWFLRRNPIFLVMFSYHFFLDSISKCSMVGTFRQSKVK
ncbi:MAG: hypothetical protein PF518_12030, partial [Spirochaetaceae bacterium]|nr:hypothetical protein [Spirochaetaceae bacterium]